MRHLTDEQLILFHYGEVDAGEEVSQHLASCAACRRNYDTLKATLGSIHLTPVPPRSPEYGAEVWRRLAPSLARPPVRGGWRGIIQSVEERLRRSKAGTWSEAGARSWAGVYGWVTVMAILALVLWFAAGQGRLFPRHRHATVEPSPRASRVMPMPSPSSKELGDHLDRSQLALIALLNSGTDGPVDISMDQVLARELVDVNRLFCRSAAGLQDSTTLSALEDIERALVDISSSPSRLSAEQFSELKRRLQPEAMLCAIRVVEARIRTGGRWNSNSS